MLIDDIVVQAVDILVVALDGQVGIYIGPDPNVIGSGVRIERAPATPFVPDGLPGVAVGED